MPARAYAHLRLSPDGLRIALDVVDQDRDIHTWDLQRSVLTRITDDRAIDRNPVWTPDSRRIAFSSSRIVPSGVFWQSADGTGQPERLTENEHMQVPMTFVPDGTRLIIRDDAQSKTGSDLRMVTIGDRRRLEPLVQTDAVETNAELSWDGLWLTYQAAATIWVVPFPDVSKGRWQVADGYQPLWSRDGRELFFLGRDGRLMRVAVQTAPTFAPSSPVPVLERAYIWNAVGLAGRSYDVSPDGRRFLMIKEADETAKAAAPPLVGVVNWLEELKSRVGSGQ